IHRTAFAPGPGGRIGESEGVAPGTGPGIAKGGAVLSRLLDHARRVIFAVRHRGDRGMSTAEYAVGTIAACGFAALLFKVVTSADVQELPVGLVNRALNVGK